MESCWLGLDIGGANCKFATSQGESWSLAFPLWRQASELSVFLQEALAKPIAEQAPLGIAMTMTGELADCFRTKQDGVEHITRSVAAVAGGLPLRVYLLDGRLATVEEACEQPTLAAAANWHALAQIAGQCVVARCGLLIDIGTTTTDIIPFSSQPGRLQGRTDSQRLCHGELVYTGIERTPLSAVLHEGRFQGAVCGIAPELFATSLDAYLWTGELAERPHDTSTADGRPATREFAFERLARMVCADRLTFTRTDADWLAQACRQNQVSLIRSALRQVVDAQGGAIDAVVWSGQADFLAADVLTSGLSDVPVTLLSDRIGRSAARCATAYAVARLAAAADRAIK